MPALRGQYHRLLLIVGPIGSGKTPLLKALCQKQDLPYLNVNLVLSQRLLDLTERERPLRVRRLLAAVLDEQSVGLLAPLDSVEVSLTLDTLALADESEIIVFADNGRAIVEADEENNIDSVVIYLTGEELLVFFNASVDVGVMQSFHVTDVMGRDLAGATVKVTLPFEDYVRTETLTTGADGRVEFMVTVPGRHSFTVSKPSYYPYFGEFEAFGEPIPVTPPLEFDMNLIYIIVIIIIIAGVVYYFLVLRR